MFVSQEALYSILEKGLEAPGITIPMKLEEHKIDNNANIDIKDFCNGIVYPVTNKSITSYHKLINGPLL